jgi:hypothetical protein
MLSHLVLLVGGMRPSPLRPDPGGSDRGTVVLTNPDLPASNGDDPVPDVSLARRSLGILREHRVDSGYASDSRWPTMVTAS